MPNPIKAIKGGINQVKASSMAVKANNQNVKAGTGAQAINKAPATKKTMTPKAVVKAFVSGAQNPAQAKTNKVQMKAMTKK